MRREIGFLFNQLYALVATNGTGFCWEYLFIGELNVPFVSFWQSYRV